MKSRRSLLIAFLVLYLFITLGPAAVFACRAPSPASSSASGGAPTPAPSAAPAPTPAVTPTPGAFTLHDAATGDTLIVPEREFLMAALACEMDLASPQEALKAQAVAAYTYYAYQRQHNAPIECDTANWSVYVPESAMQARWGESYADYAALLAGTVDAVLGQTLTYEGQLAMTAFFAISPGSTADAAEVFADAAGAHPYLRPVASPGDAFSDGYLSTVDLTVEEFRAAAAAHFAGADLSGPAGTWLTELERGPSGIVKTAVLGGTTVTGTQLRTAFGLRSAGFEVSLDENGFHFTVRGWGHGVGMSQAGAVFMAKRGAGYEDILAHYYPGTELSRDLPEPA